MATVATERKNGNGTTERHNGMAERNVNGMVETRHWTDDLMTSLAEVLANHGVSYSADFGCMLV